MDSETKELIDKQYEDVHHENLELHNIWIEHILFSWQWWIALSLTIIPWILWIFFRRKESTSRLLYAGFFVIFISSWLDFLGVISGLWSYHVDLLFTIPSYVVWDFTLIPVSIMFFLQIKTNFNPFIKAVVFSGIATFIGEPLLDWLDFYHPKEWRIWYSFPIYILIYLIAYFLATRESFKKFSN